MRPLEPDLQLAGSLLDALHRATAADAGVTRDSYGAGEQAAHGIVAEAGTGLGLEVETDAAGNLYLTLAGADRTAPRLVIGSHLDSVPAGGNYDGAAGVVAGLSVLSALRGAGETPARDVTVTGVRAEESTWFPASYIGSRAALGLLPEDCLEIVRADTGRTLRAHMSECGFDPDAVARGQAHLRPAEVAAYIEPHIEQGPVLVRVGKPVGLVTGIRGSFRHRQARCLGTYAHSGATPRDDRRDAVFAVSALVARLDALWADLECEGHDLAITVGQIATDPREHAFSKVPGRVDFCLDVRSASVQTLDSLRVHLAEIVAGIETERQVHFELGEITGSTPALMAPGLIRIAEAAAADLGVPVWHMASGAGHDAAVFAAAGVPAAMLFIRNENGSHNPHEHMGMEDFGAACRVLLEMVRRFPN